LNRIGWLMLVWLIFVNLAVLIMLPYSFVGVMQVFAYTRSKYDFAGMGLVLIGVWIGCFCMLAHIDLKVFRERKKGLDTIANVIFGTKKRRVD